MLHSVHDFAPTDILDMELLEAFFWSDQRLAELHDAWPTAWALGEDLARALLSILLYKPSKRRGETLDGIIIFIFAEFATQSLPY